MNRSQRIAGIWALVLATAGPVGADYRPVGPVECTAERTRELDLIVQRQLEYYSRLLPRIQFAVLSDRMARGLGMLELLNLLGEDAANLDYEHPPALRADLLEASIARVGMHLQGNSTSSALFRVGNGASAGREQLCVITLDACAVARDNLQATRHMLDLPEDVIARMPVERHLDADQHLEYVIDHEVRHCLASHRGHPIPMSTREHWAGYVQLRNEHAADAYALAMHIQRHGAGSANARTMTHIRGLALLLGDPDHYTANAMQAVPAVLEAAGSVASGIERAYTVAETIRQRFDPGYDGYLKYRHAASGLMNRIGIPDALGPALLNELPGYLPERDRVNALCRDMSIHYQALFGGSLNIHLE